ncbi:alpha/beta fold hydrolase [Streptomyces sp. NPDC093085]|uniref:alpha/beta fold hydrolase n=1 Tax=Streptomyces sp. NPDC093085 TaxID=3155068 RepID=UPI00343E38EE
MSVPLAHETHGAGTGLVLLHGVGLDRRMWDRCLPGLAAAHRVTLADLRGHGASPAAGASTSCAALAGDVAALVERTTHGEGREGPVHLVGFSLGALVAQRLAVDRPELVASLTLVSSVAARSARERAAVAERRRRAAEDFGASARAAVERWFAPAWRAREPETADAVLRTLLATDHASYLACYDIFGTADAELWPLLPGIAAPTLAITGVDDPGSTPEMTRRLAARIPGARGAVVPDTRHLLPLERPDPLVTAVLAHTAEAEGAEGTAEVRDGAVPRAAPAASAAVPPPAPPSVPPAPPVPPSPPTSPSLPTGQECPRR